MTNILIGSHYFLDGFKLIFKPGIKRFVIIPLLINFILLVGLFFLSKHYFAFFSNWLMQHLPHWLQWLSFLVWTVYFLGYLLFMAYGFVTVANLISAPFNGLLAEKIEFYLTGKQHNPTWFDLVKDIPRMLNRQLAILGFYIPRVFLIIILFFIPIIHFGAVIVWFLFNAWFITLQYIDFPTDNHRIPLSTVREQLRENRGLTLGFGMTAAFFATIPFLNIFAMPAAVAGATKLWLEKFKNPA